MTNIWLDLSRDIRPEIGEIVLTYKDSQDPINIARFKTGQGFVDVKTGQSLPEQPTHWLPIPKRPDDINDNFNFKQMNQVEKDRFNTAWLQFLKSLKEPNAD